MRMNIFMSFIMFLRIVSTVIIKIIIYKYFYYLINIFEVKLTNTTVVFYDCKVT